MAFTMEGHEGINDPTNNDTFVPSQVREPMLRCVLNQIQLLNCL